MVATTILELEKPAQGYENWHIPTNANWDALENKLSKAYQNIWVVGQITYFTSNAKYSAGWTRISDSYGATMIAQDNSNKTITNYYCASGSGAISWLALKIPNVDLTFTSAVNLNSNTLSNVGNVNTIGNIGTVGTVSNCGLINFKSTNKTVPIPDTGFGNVRKLSTTGQSTSSAGAVTAYTFTVPSNYGDGSIAVRVSARTPGDTLAHIKVSSTTYGSKETKSVTSNSGANIDFLGVAVAGGDTVTISFWRECGYTIYTNGYSVACFEGIPNTQTWS